MASHGIGTCTSIQEILGDETNDNPGREAMDKHDSVQGVSLFSVPLSNIGARPIQGSLAIGNL